MKKNTTSTAKAIKAPFLQALSPKIRQMTSPTRFKTTTSIIPAPIPFMNLF